jgi:hypothetical protein
MKILCKYPTRSRPSKFLEVFDLYNRMASGKHELSFVLTLDEDDVTMNNPAMRRMLSRLEDRGVVKSFFGSSKSKIQAVNADMIDPHTGATWDFDILILVSDDMIPEVAGYDGIVVAEMLASFPDLDGVVHYNDGLRGESLNTLSIMGRKYYERFGYIYHPDYASVFADNEFTQVSRALGKAVYRDQVIIRHRWMEQGKDALYARNEDNALYARDHEVFTRRMKEGFP